MEYQIKPIGGFPAYKVSNIGEVWSRWARVPLLGGGSRIYIGTKWKKIKTFYDKDGYVRAYLSRDKKQYKVRIHRLVLETFVGPCPNRMECRHLDGNASNNKVENLAWGTSKENMADKKRHGTNIGPRGEKQHTSKLTEEKVKTIRTDYKKGRKQIELSKEFGVSRGAINNIIRRISWKHI